MRWTRRPWIMLMVLATGLWAAAARAEFVRASRNTTVRDQATSDATVLFRMPKGAELTLAPVQDHEGFYAVVLPAGGEGFVPRSSVRRHGEAARGTLGPVAPLGLVGDRAPPPAQPEAATRHLAIGKPEILYERLREGYAVGIDGRLRVPAWVQYQLSRSDLGGNVSRQGYRFKPDETVPPQGRAAATDFSGGPYEIGHMAPAEDMTTSDDRMRESFITSNALPQWGAGFNGGVWAQLERATRDWVAARGTLTIINGPIFAPEAAPPAAAADLHWSGQIRFGVVGNNRVAVPTHLFKIIIDANDPANPHALAWVFPNQRLTGEKFTDPRYWASIAEIEARTGLELLGGLPAEVRTPLKAAKQTALWPRPPD